MSKVKRQNKSLKDGDMYLSVTKGKAVEAGQVVKFIPLYAQKLIQTYENESKIATWEGAKKGKWVGTEALTKENQKLPVLDVGYIRHHVKSMYACILAEGFSSLLPIRIDFKRSSADSFQPLLEKIALEMEQGKRQTDLVFELSIESVQGEKGDYFVWKVDFLDYANDQEKAQAAKQLALIKSMSKDELLNDADLTEDEESESVNDDIPNYAPPL